MNKEWEKSLERIFSTDEYKKLIENINQEYLSKKIFPARDNIYKALELTPLSEVKVVILGQDPYHGENQAIGLSFAVNDDIKLPPSLKNIYKELTTDLNTEIRTNGNLTSWAKEGVLLLNSVLTVEKGKPGSHKDLGWNKVTDEIISIVNKKTTPVVFILWGNFAISKEHIIDNPIHYIIKSPHPSPFSARKGFFGSKPFSKTNEFLKRTNQKEINW